MSVLKTNNLEQGISKVKEEIITLKNEIKILKSANKSELSFEEKDGIKVLVAEVENGDIKEIIDDAKNAHDKVALLLFQKKGEKVMIAAGSKNTPIKAGAWIKVVAPILGGGGGGRDDFAQAGGKDASKLSQALHEAQKFLNENLA